MIQESLSSSAHVFEAPGSSPIQLNISPKSARWWWLLGVFIFFVWYQMTVNVLYENTLWFYSGFIDFLIGTAVGFGMIFFMFLFNTIFVAYIKWKRNKLWRIGLDFILAQATPVLTAWIFMGVSFIFNKTPNIRWLDVYIINFMIFTIIETVWFVGNYQYTKRLYERQLRLSTQFEYYALRSQVNPHFLFNSLNILYSLMHIDTTKSQEFLLALSRLYRYIMGRSERSAVPLCDEIDFLHDYADVLRILYYECFELEIIGEIPSKAYLIPFSLQLLIENVTKHNVIDSKNPMTVHVHIFPDAIVVTNNITLKKHLPKEMEGKGIGLKYLTELYRMHHKTFSYGVEDDNFVAKVPYI